MLSPAASAMRRSALNVLSRAVPASSPSPLAVTAAALARSANRAPLLPATCSSAAPSSRLSGRRAFSQSSASEAVSTTPTSSINDPAEEEAQRFLEEGTALIESGDIENAKKAYERSLAIKESSSALFNLGVCQYHNKDLTEAIASWNRVIELSPSSSDAHMNIASAFVMSVPPRPDLAVDHLKTAASISPEDAEIQFNLGAVLEACEQLEEAAKAYKRALDGGIARAETNLRNISAKLASALLAVKEHEINMEKAAQEAAAEKKDT
ncbi:unnamed protein product [Tilletia controversa]|uniref:Uncharacterized protein n=1 Tax=Tilletia controversa TaxID=13291 RepID=A0A8X7MPI9_9BASI|nr:hypothetical protein CF328_g5254 [Tilletia controversa]KAE8243945.1 hypothetical protein A4X06_0g6043 [Tilletia controversa]CAD6939064.1 unnamed protein product [Tilletia controversa]